MMFTRNSEPMTITFRSLPSLQAFSVAIVCLFAFEVLSQTKPAKPRQTAKPTESLKTEASDVANNYWSKRFTKCGELVVWGVLRQTRGVRITNLELVRFASKDAPTIVVEEVPLMNDKEKIGGSDSQSLEWSGRSRISIKSAQDVHPARSLTQSTWYHNLTYAITIRRTEGVWEAVEDQPGERALAQPLFEDLRAEHPMILESCLRFGGDPNMRNESGETLLIAAGNRGSEYAVGELLSRDADANLKDRNGWTASYLARLNNNESVARLIDQAGGICEGPIKGVCEKYPKPPQPPFDGSTVMADPLLIPPDSRLTKPEPRPRKPDNSTKVVFFGIPQPEYTAEARRNKITGTVVLSIVFLPSGEAGNIRVIAGLPYGLTAQAIEAAKKIKFIPATLDGQKVAIEKRIEFNFKLP